MREWLHRWFAPKPQLTLVQAKRLAAWQVLSANSLGSSFEHSRCIVLDVETTGLNLMSDRLISIGAVAVTHARIDLGDSFSVVLQQRNSSSKENILIHGITDSVQREGMEPADALLDFLEFLGNSPLVAFHVTFDETMIRRAMRQYLGFSFKQRWLDLACVLPALYPGQMHRLRALDDWAAYFKLRNDQRHNALADALVTAQLLLLAINAARKNGNPSHDSLRSLERTFRHSSGY